MWLVTQSSSPVATPDSHSVVPKAARAANPTRVATKCAARCGFLANSVCTAGTKRRATACSANRPATMVPISMSASSEKPNDLQPRGASGVGPALCRVSRQGEQHTSSAVAVLALRGPASNCTYNSCTAPQGSTGLREMCTWLSLSRAGRPRGSALYLTERGIAASWLNAEPPPPSTYLLTVPPLAAWSVFS